MTELGRRQLVNLLSFTVRAYAPRRHLCKDQCDYDDGRAQISEMMRTQYWNPECANYASDCDAQISERGI